MIKKAKIRYGTINLPYHVIKSKRIKTSEIIVEANNVTIRTPLNKDLSEIRRIVSDKASWILKKQKEYRETIPQIIKKIRLYPILVELFLKNTEKANN